MTKESEGSGVANEGVNSTDSERDPRKAFPYAAAVTVGTIVWGYFITKRINRMLVSRYGNVVYQIRRAESLRNRYTAFKFLVAGGILVPSAISGAIYWTIGSQRKKEDSPETGETIAISKVASNRIHQYTHRASKRLEQIAEGAKATLVPEGISGIGEDLRKDISALKRWFGKLF